MGIEMDRRALLNQLLEMGFPENRAEEACTRFSDLDNAISYLTEGASESQEMLPIPRNSSTTRPRSEKDEIQQAIALSLQDPANGEEDAQVSIAVEQSLMSGPKLDAPVYQRVREHGHPAGLVNTGNTCYVNSILQTYFFLPLFRNIIFDEVIDELKFGDIVKELRLLYGRMLAGKQRYEDPTPLLRALQIPVYIGASQQDVSEFNILFLEQVERGIREVRSELGDELHRMLFGKVREIVLFSEEDGSRHTREQTSECAQIILDIAEGNDADNIYKSLDRYTHDSVEQYVTENGHTCVADKDTFFEELPPVLVFLLQRTRYDSSANEVVKSNAPFMFDKYLYMDRYFMSFRETIAERRRKVSDLQREMEVYMNEYMGIMNYKNHNASLDCALNCVADFVEDFVGNSEGNFGEFVTLLRTKSEEVSLRKQELEREIQRLRMEMSCSFDDMRNEAYELSLVLIHDGVGSSGHYTTLIYDSCTDTYCRISDAEVTPGYSEEEMYRQSVGGHGIMSAYCLVYCKVDPNRCLFQPLREDSLNTLPSNVRSIVSLENDAFLKEYNRWEDSALIRITSMAEDNYRSNVPRSCELFQDIENFLAFVSRVDEECSRSIAYRQVYDRLFSKGGQFDNLKDV